MRRFANKVALVTGGARGIGFAISARLAAEGAAVGILALHEETAAAAAAEIEREGGVALPLGGDVADEADVRRCVERAAGALGGIDVLVNNAGAVAVGRVTEMTAEEWDRVLAVNLRGAFLACREVARQLLAQGRGGRILNCSSIAGRHGAELFAPYVASKFGVIGLTQSLAAELAGDGITVNAYCPGHITTTPMWDTIDRELGRLTGRAVGASKQLAALETPLGRAGTPEEIASVVAFLVSDENSFMTGETVVIDGGLTRF